MEAYPLNAQGIVDEFELPGVIGAQRQQRVSTSHAKLPMLFMGNGRGIFANQEFHIHTSFFYIPVFPNS
jgi:hypothetical protein